MSALGSFAIIGLVFAAVVFVVVIGEWFSTLLLYQDDFDDLYKAHWFSRAMKHGLIAAGVISGLTLVYFLGTGVQTAMFGYPASPDWLADFGPTLKYGYLVFYACIALVIFKYEMGWSFKKTLLIGLGILLAVVLSTATFYGGGLALAGGLLAAVS